MVSVHWPGWGRAVPTNNDLVIYARHTLSCGAALWTKSDCWPEGRALILPTTTFWPRLNKEGADQIKTGMQSAKPHFTYTNLCGSICEIVDADIRPAIRRDYFVLLVFVFLGSVYAWYTPRLNIIEKCNNFMWYTPIYAIYIFLRRPRPGNGVCGEATALLQKCSHC